MENGQYAALALADGASACRCGGNGAAAACKAAAAYALANADMLRTFSGEKIAYLLLEQVNHVLGVTAAALGAPADALGSTLCLCLLFKARRERLLLGLGDGAVYTFSAGGVRQAIRPKRFGGCRTVLTTTRDAYRHAAVRLERAAAADGVFLCSDGVLAALGETALAACLQTAGADPQLTALQARLDTARCPDDCGFLSRIP